MLMSLPEAYSLQHRLLDSYLRMKHAVAMSNIFHWQHKATMQMCPCAMKQFSNGSCKAYLTGRDMLTDMLMLAQMDKLSNH